MPKATKKKTAKADAVSENQDTAEVLSSNEIQSADIDVQSADVDVPSENVDVPSDFTDAYGDGYGVRRWKYRRNTQKVI